MTTSRADIEGVSLQILCDAALRSIKADPSHARGRKFLRRSCLRCVQLARLKSGQRYCLIYINATAADLRFGFCARWNGSLLSSFGACSEAHLQDALGRALSPAYRSLPESALFLSASW